MAAPMLDASSLNQAASDRRTTLLILPESIHTPLPSAIMGTHPPRAPARLLSATSYKRLIRPRTEGPGARLHQHPSVGNYRAIEPFNIPGVSTWQTAIKVRIARERKRTGFGAPTAR